MYVKHEKENSKKAVNWQSSDLEMVSSCVYLKTHTKSHSIGEEQISISIYLLVYLVRTGHVNEHTTPELAMG